MKRRINKLAYELNLSSKWQIHSIIFIMQLKSTSKNVDFYNRFRFSHFDVVEMKKTSNIDWKKSYEMKKLIKKKNRKYEKTKMIKYLIKWLKYEFEFDEWKSLSILANFIILMKNYEKVNFQSIISVSNTIRAIDFISSISKNSKRKRNKFSKIVVENQQKRKKNRFKKINAFWINAYVDFVDE